MHRACPRHPSFCCRPKGRLHHLCELHDDLGLRCPNFLRVHVHCCHFRLASPFKVVHVVGRDLVGPGARDARVQVQRRRQHNRASISSKWHVFAAHKRGTTAWKCTSTNCKRTRRRPKGTNNRVPSLHGGLPAPIGHPHANPRTLVKNGGVGIASTASAIAAGHCCC